MESMTKPTTVVLDRRWELRCRLAADTDDPRDCVEHAGTRYAVIRKYQMQGDRAVISPEWAEAPYVLGYVYR